MRSRFIRSEVALFKSRFETDDVSERAQFLAALNFNWILVSSEEKNTYAEQLKKCIWANSKDREDTFRSESWFKVPWYTVPDLVGQRRVFIKGGMAYVPQSLQISLVLQEFTSRLEAALEVSAPRQKSTNISSFIRSSLQRICHGWMKMRDSARSSTT